MHPIDSRPHQPAPINAPRPAEAGNGVMVLCTYCGSLSVTTNKCSNCSGHFDLLSRQRTQNGMGPWFIRDQVNPFHPGCSYETLRRLVERGRVRPDTVVRGPTTRQFWSFARNTPGVAHLLGACHACHVPVDSSAAKCPNCNASFIVANDRQNLGLAPVQLLPGDADPSAIADAAFGPATPAAPPTPVQSGRPSPERAEPEFDRPTQSPSPRRRKSAAPMIAVVTSVCCAAIALTALVMMSRSPGTPAAAAAESERDAATEPQPDAESRTETTSAHDPEPASPGVPLDDTPAEAASTPAPEPIPDERIAEAPEQESPPANSEPTPVSNSDTRVRPGERAIGSMGFDELQESAAGWRQQGRPELVAAAELRLEHLRLRRLFGR